MLFRALGWGLEGGWGARAEVEGTGKVDEDGMWGEAGRRQERMMTREGGRQEGRSRGLVEEEKRGGSRKWG